MSTYKDLYRQTHRICFCRRKRSEDNEYDKRVKTNVKRQTLKFTSSVSLDRVFYMEFMRPAEVPTGYFKQIRCVTV